MVEVEVEVDVDPTPVVVVPGPVVVVPFEPGLPVVAVVPPGRVVDDDVAGRVVVVEVVVEVDVVAGGWVTGTPLPAGVAAEGGRTRT